jgi:hypothetical protein
MPETSAPPNRQHRPLRDLIRLRFAALLHRRWPHDLGPLVLVWGIWLVLARALYHYVRWFPVDAPWMDEWEVIPTLTGHLPLTWKWLWSLHNEHRIVIPRLIYLAVVRLSGDFRAGCFFSAGVLTISAAAMIVVARRLRGSTIYSDAIFPVIAMHVGQWENLLFSLHVVWTSGAALVTAVLLIIVQPGPLSFRASLGLALCAIMLPLCGGNGLAFAPACVAIVMLAGWQVRKVSPHGRWATAAVWALGLAGVAVMALYFVGYTRPAKHPPNHVLEKTIEGAMQFLASGLGVATSTTWPSAKYALYISSAAIALAMLGAFVSRVDERPRVARLVLFLGAVCALAFGTSWARRALGAGMLFSTRYETAAAAFWFATYFAWEVVDHRSLRRTAQALLFALAASFLVANRNEGLANSGHGRNERIALQNDVRAGVPLEQVAAKHWSRVYYPLYLSISKDDPAGADTFRERLKMLRERRFGIFRDLK